MQTAQFAPANGWTNDQSGVGYLDFSCYTKDPAPASGPFERLRVSVELDENDEPVSAYLMRICGHFNGSSDEEQSEVEVTLPLELAAHIITL